MRRRYVRTRSTAPFAQTTSGDTAIRPDLFDLEGNEILNMSRARKELRDAKRGIRFVNRVVLTVERAPGQGAQMRIDCGGMLAPDVIKLLRNAASSIETELQEQSEKAKFEQQAKQ